MKRIVILFLALLCLVSCQRNRDKVVAQVYNHKLYLSEVESGLPSGLSPEDSVAMVKDYIDSWVKERLILHEAEHQLSVREKNFDKQLENYRRSLLINAYYDKLVSDTNMFGITDQDVEAFTRAFDGRYAVNKEIVKVNYVKLSANSKLGTPVKEILFNENRRQEEKDQLMRLFGDSVEYMLDDNAWLYLEDVRAEVPFDLKTGDLKTQHQYVDKTIDGSRYLLVVLDYKNQRAASETEEERAAVRMMLMNQRKQQYIENYINDIYKKALKEGAVTR